jgi:hypothetical protein
MDTSQPWVERLFFRLQVRYGARWSRMWEDIDPLAIKADWEECLGNLYLRHPEALVYGLEHLPENPPTSDQFRAICLRAPDNTPRLPPPNSKGNRELMDEVRRMMVESSKEKDAMTPAAYCAMRLRRHDRLGPAQRAMLESCETMLLG